MYALPSPAYCWLVDGPPPYVSADNGDFLRKSYGEWCPPPPPAACAVDVAVEADEDAADDALGGDVLVLGVTGLFVLLFVFTGFAGFVGLFAAVAAAATPPDTAAPTFGGSQGSESCV